MKPCPKKRYTRCNVAKNRVPKAVPKSSSKRHKRKEKSTANMSTISSFVGAVDRLSVLMRGASVTSLAAFIFDYWQHMKTGSIAINQEEGDIDTMPVALEKSLMPAKIGNKNPLRDNDAKTSAKNTTKDASPCPSLPPPHVPYYQYPQQY